MLFAAGFGTRMRPLTDRTPKPLIEVAGRPLLDHALALADDAKIPQKLVNAHYLPEQIETYAAARGLRVSKESPVILDTGGGLKHALPELGHPRTVYTLNTDAVWTGPNPLETLAAAWEPDRMDALLAVIAVNTARGYNKIGDFTMDADGRLFRGPGMVYSGAQIMATKLLQDMPDGAFSLNLCWEAAAESGRLFGVLHTGGWCDVGHPGGIAMAEAMLAEPTTR